MAETPGILPGANDYEKLGHLITKTYEQQAIWFLNSFWDAFASKEGERLWNYVQKCSELDDQHHAEGCGLDEMKAHVFLEAFDETLTVRALREKLRGTGAIGEKERPKLVPLTHYLLFRFDVDWHVLVNASQGDNSKEIAEAQRMLEEVRLAFEEADRTAKAAAAALREATAAEGQAVAREESAKAAESEALAREAEAREAEAPFKICQEELLAALADLKRQEDEYQGKIADCKQRSETGGVVSRNKAKAELEILLSEDPLPLRRAKITTEAAEKRADKARAPFEAATKKAEAARAEATAAANEATAAREAASAARAASERAREAAEHAVQEAKARVQEAEDYLEELKSTPGSADGALWYMSRQLEERKKFIPMSKGGIERRK